MECAEFATHELRLECWLERLVAAQEAAAVAVLVDLLPVVLVILVALLGVQLARS